MEGVELAERRLVVAANRGPVSFHERPLGRAGRHARARRPRHRPHRGPAPPPRHLGGGGAGRRGAPPRRREARRRGRARRRRRTACATSPSTADAYHKYYNIVANPMLWFIQHYLWDLGRHPDIRAEEMDAWHNGYLSVNEQFAKAVVDEVRRGPTGAGAAARPATGATRWCCCTTTSCTASRRTSAPPAPAPSCTSSSTSRGRRATTGACCREHIRNAVFRGLLGNDVVAFHTRHYVRNFLRCCADLLDLEVDEARWRRALRGPRGVGARLPGEHRPGVAARRRAARAGRAPPSASCAAGGASSCCCASTASTSARTSSAASSPSTASSSCTPSSRSASRSSRCCSPRARTSRST